MKLIERYIVSLTNLYGIVHQDKVIEIYNAQNKEHLERTDISQADEEVLEGKFVYIEGNYFVHYTILEFDEMEEELVARKGKPFYVPPRNELLKYEEDTYFEKNTHYYALRRYLRKNFSKDAPNIAEYCDDFQLMCEIGDDVQYILQRMQQLGVVIRDQEQLQELAELCKFGE